MFPTSTTQVPELNSNARGIEASPRPDTNYKVIHVVVALCDNRYQGIVPVPAAIGNGQDPKTNLYWGCSYGVREYFKNSKKWTFLEAEKGDSLVLERVFFRHKLKNWYLVAEAYDGRYIRQTMQDFLKYAAGKGGQSCYVNGLDLGTGGNARLVAYIGHNGLMDFTINETLEGQANQNRQAIMLACCSKKYFQNHLRLTGISPLLWSTGLMSPEAYTLHDALEAYIGGKESAVVSQAAAGAYSRYQRCSQKAAENLLVTGW